MEAFRATPRHCFIDRVFQYQGKESDWREIITRDTDEADAARRYTCSIIGRPAMSASAFPGRRVDWYLAGMTATAESKPLEKEGPVFSTGGTTNLTTPVTAC